MKASTIVALGIAALALNAWNAPASADSAAANCDVRKEGETKKGASGPCTFSQRQGYIDLDLKNGDTYSLSPTGQPNHYKDQNGKKVQRTQAGGNTQEFKWEGGKKVIVTFAGGNAVAGTYPAAAASTHGDPARELQYLVNGPYVGGEVDDQLLQRGYQSVSNRVDGKNVSSYWRQSSSGKCVVLHFHDSRVKSIASAPDSCR